MKALLLLLAGFLFVGCEYATPVVTQNTKKLDPRLLGVWQNEDQDESQKVLILKLTDREYLFQYPLNQEDGHYFITTLTEVAGFPLLQMKCIGTVEGNKPDGERLYSLATYEIDGDHVQLRLLNSGLISKDLDTPTALKLAIQDHRNNPDLFRDPTTFKKVLVE